MATLGSVAKTAAPKVGRTLGTLNSKKVALGTTTSVGQNLTDRIQNAQGKIQELGGDVPKPKTTALGWLLENLPRTGYGATNMIRELLQPDEGLTPGEFDPLAAWMRGFNKIEQPLGKDIMTGFGLEGDKAMLTGGDPHIYNPSAAGLAGLLLDIFNPADPLNWIGFGTGSAVKSGGLRGAKALEKSFGSQSAQRIASLLGDEAVSDIGARSVGRIIKQVTEGGKKIGLDETGMKNLTNYLRQGMSEAGTNPKTKVNYWQGKPITVGLQNPFTLGLKGNFAEFAVPGSEHLTGAISKGINKFKQTRVGDTLGEMFEVGHVSKDAPQKLFVRSTTKDLDELVKRHRQGKIKLPATAKEIAAMKEDLNKISLVNVYDTNTATGGINFDLLAGIVGVDSGTLMELFDQRLPFTYNIGELFKVFKKADVEDAVAFRQSVMLRGVMDKLIDIIPNEYRSLFKGTVMTPGIGVEYFRGTLADNVGNIRNAASPYINYIFERNGVGIAIPVNVGENFNEAVWKKLDTAVAAIDELPSEVRKKIVQDIQIAPHNLGEYVDEKTGIKTIDPQGMTLQGQITLADPDMMMDTLKHESGHIVWQNNPELADRYVQAAQQEISQGKRIGVTDYGYAHIANTAGKASERESFKEDFAEAIYRALTDPELFVQEHPLRAKVIQEAIYDGSITPDELVAIKEVAEARADKIAKSYGVEKQLDSVLNRVDDAVEDVMMNGSEDMIDAQIATKQFTRDITRVFEKSLSTSEDFRLAVKQIWKNVSPEESREILRIASEFDSSAMRSMSDPSFLEMRSQSDKVKYNQITKEWKQSWEPYYEVKHKMLMPGELDINSQRNFTGQEPGRYRIPTDMTADQYPTHMFDIIDKNTGEVITTLTSKQRLAPSMTVAMIEAFRRNPELATKYGIKPQPDLLPKNVNPNYWVQESAVPSFFNAQRVETPENLYRIVGSDALDESGNLRPIRSDQYGTYWAPSIDDLEGWSHEIIGDWVNGDEVHLIKINSNKDMKIINADDAEFQIDFVRKLKDRYGFNYEQWVKNQYGDLPERTKIIQAEIEDFYDGEWTYQINRLLDMAEDASVPQGKIKDLIEADGLYSTATADDFGAEIFIPDNIENEIIDRRTIDAGAYLDEEIDFPSFYSAINDRLNPTYYSKLRQVVDEKMSNSMPVKDLKNMLKSNGVKDEEIKWTFLDEFFDAKGGKVTKEEVQQWLDWNNLEVQEIMKRSTTEQARAKELLDRLGDEDVGALIDDLYEEGMDRDDILKIIADEYNLSIEDASLLETSITDPEYFQELSDRNAAKWGQHTEPGGEDYREIIFTLPLDYNTPKTGPESISSFNEPAYTKPSHWKDVDNPVAHVRFDTRYTPEGKKILFIEELQSDWHQEGWTKGYRDIEYKRKYEELKAKRNKKYQELYHQFIEEPGITGLRANEIALTLTDHPEIQTITKEMKELGLELQGLIADAPFKNTWRELTLKRLVKYASEEGFDGISWTSGAQQNKRWSQVDDVDLITYSPETKSLTSYYKDGDGYSIEDSVTIESEKDLKKYLTNEQIAKLTDTTPLELRVESFRGWDFDTDLKNMETVELDRLIEHKGVYYDKFRIVDQYGNHFPYVYDDEASALKAIDDYYTVGQGHKVLSQGDLQWGGGGFRLSYDERIPRDMEKLTKRFKLKTEDLKLTGKELEKIPRSEQGTLRYFWEAEETGWQASAEDFVRFNMNENEITAIEVLPTIDDEMKFASDEDLDTLLEVVERVAREDGSFNQRIFDRESNRLRNQVSAPREDMLFEIEEADFPIDIYKETGEKLMDQKGIIFTDEAKDFFRENAFPLFKKTNNIDPDIQKVDEAISHLSEEAQNAFREFIKWRESIVKEYQKRDIPINVLEKYVPFVFTRKGTADEMLALNALFGTGSMPEADNLSSLINWLSGYDPNLRPRTTQATNPLEVNKVLKKPILSEDGAVIMATRGTRAIQATELYDFAEEFMGQYGRTVDEMAEYGNIKGYSLYKPKTTPDGRRVFEKVTSADKIMDNDPSVMFLPEELVKIYNDYTDMVFGKQGMNRLLKTYDKATSLYKKLAYLWNPGHIMRDFTGNVFNGYLMGLTNPKYYKEAFDYMMNPDMMVKVPGFTDMTAKQFMSKCRQNGVLDIGSSLAEFAGDPVIGMKKGKNPAMKALNGYGWAMRMGTRQSDTFTRLAGMLYQLRQGRSFDEAAVQVKKFYFDYFELTSFERNVMKRIIPFYTWMRKNIPLQLEMMIKNPRELARISDAMNAAAGEPIDWSEQPEYIQEAGAFPLGNLNHYLSPNLPYSDLSRGIPNLETAKNWLSAVNPIIRAPIELATNTQWFNGRPIENYGGEQRDLPLAGLLRALGVETPTVSKRGAGYLADQIPLLRNLDAVTNPDNPRQMEKASTFLGGPGLYKKDAVQTSSQYEYLKLLQDLIRLLQEQNQNIVE